MTVHDRPRRTLRLRLLQTTDMHGQVVGYDYVQDRPAPDRGLDRLARLIATARAEVPGAVLCDCGDFLQGTPLCDLAALPDTGPDAPGSAHPVIAAMNLLRYDAVALGNHEFDYGMAVLRAALEQARFPVTCANLRSTRGDPPLGLPWVMVTRDLRDQAGRRARLRIGLFGLAPPLIAVWSRDQVAGQITLQDPLTTARQIVSDLRAAGADVIVALNHTGIARGRGAAENTALTVAALPGVDAVLCGHQHRLFPGPDFADLPTSGPEGAIDAELGRLAGKPAVMAGTAARHLGVIDLTLQGSPGDWRVSAAQVAIRSLSGTGPDSPRPQLAFARTLRGAHDRTLGHIRRRVGTLTAPLHNHFARIGDCAALQLVAAAQRARVQQLLAGTPWQALPLLSAVAPFRAGGPGSGTDHVTDIAPGPLTMRHLADLYPYPNTLAAVQVTGAELACWLERAAAMFHRLTPGVPDQPLIRSDFPSYNFDVIFGLTYQIDLSQPACDVATGPGAAPASRRITDLRLGDQPLNPAALYVVATNSYRAAGAGFFDLLATRGIPLATRESNLSVLTAHVCAQGPITPCPMPVWRFAPLPGTSAIFATAPSALAHAAARPDLQPLGCDTDGLARFRLML